VASPAKKFIQREIGKLVRKEGKKSSMKIADRLWSEYNRGTSRFYNNLLNWGKRRAEKAKLKKSKKKVRKTK
jgi:hypothetical protein